MPVIIGAEDWARWLDEEPLEDPGVAADAIRSGTDCDVANW
jgi:putative SOS response-associated peptidase YedK